MRDLVPASGGSLDNRDALLALDRTRRMADTDRDAAIARKRRNRPAITSSPSSSPSRSLERWLLRRSVKAMDPGGR